MKDQIQQHAMPLHDGPSQCLPKPVKNQITQMSQVKDFEVYSYVFTFKDCNDNILIKLPILNQFKI